MNISECDITDKALKCLKSAGIYTTEELSKTTNDDLMKIQNLGRRTLQEIIDFRRCINTYL